MADPRALTAGTFRYGIDLVPIAGAADAPSGLFSRQLTARIARENTPESRLVHFDGQRACIEEVNFDYGVRSRALELRTHGSDTVVYCKELVRVGFCIEYPARGAPGGPPAHCEALGETALISGFHCHKAQHRAAVDQLIWYTHDLAVEDPTGAVLRLPGVPGTLVRTERIANAGDAWTTQVTLTDVSFDPPPDEVFVPPPGHRLFQSVDAARAEDRRLLDAKAAEEVRLHLLGEDERQLFEGHFRLETEHDRISVHIEHVRADELRFRTVVETAPEHVSGRTSDERASVKGLLLLVEEPPNYRLYSLEDGGRRLKQLGSSVFEFVRS